MNLFRNSVAAAVIFISLTLAVAEVYGFAEEPIAFRDPFSLTVYSEEESTIHTELTYILALAAGFSEQDASTIVIWDQLVDSENLTVGSPTYTNCLGSYAAAPNRNDVCPDGFGLGQQIWPMTFDNTCATSRFGPYSPFFHFPHNTTAELGALKEWGWGRNTTLIGYSAYAWGGPTDTVLTAACRYMRPEQIDIGIAAGSLQAFGTYLHSLADYHSHSGCLTALAALPDEPNLWGTHTVVPQQDTLACYYVPSEPKNTDAHGQEFGTGLGIGRTKAAAAAMFSELVWRSTQWWGTYAPLSMGTELGGAFGSTILQTAIYQLIENWDFQKETGLNPDPAEYAMQRRSFSDQIVTRILALRQGTELVPPACPNNGPVWLGGSNYEAGVKDAYLSLTQPGAMKITNETLPTEDLDFIDADKNFSITLLGGYDCSFTAQEGFTTITGKMTISSGTIVADRLIFSSNITL
ncbi:MAG: hypothetical protein C0402_14070 [Thermodesulfovibrio sp.]|nr:hypothetical protein [Thermodesulfovibrio sp.]